MFRLLVLSLFLVTISFPARAESRGGDGSLLISTSDGRQLDFNIDLALTPEQRAQGLMFVENLPEDKGMLFFFGEEQLTGFWMKNTLIPLDMIFIRQNGRIVKIHENAMPHDLTSISSGEPVAAVLEINGGQSRKLGIAPGDTVRHELFGNVLAP